MGSTPFRNVGGCAYCGVKIEPLNGLCPGCDEERPWLKPRVSERERVLNEVYAVLAEFAQEREDALYSAEAAMVRAVLAHVVLRTNTRD